MIDVEDKNHLLRSFHHFDVKHRPRNGVKGVVVSLPLQAGHHRRRIRIFARKLNRIGKVFKGMDYLTGGAIAIGVSRPQQVVTADHRLQSRARHHRIKKRYPFRNPGIEVAFVFGVVVHHPVPRLYPRDRIVLGGRQGGNFGQIINRCVRRATIHIQEF